MPAGIESMENCRICPRNCGADRMAGKTGRCGVPADPVLSRAALHFWEEPCISGKRGSGAVFFSGCSLQCVYCQNDAVAKARTGKKVSVDRLAEIFLELQEKGACNINLVTPTHYVPQIAAAAEKAENGGLHIPFVYNTGGYDDPEMLQCLEGIVDIYLTDFKYIDPETAKRYSAAGDYPDIAARALEEMMRQCPEPVFDTEEMMQRGVIVRHLLLPGQVRNAKKIVKYVFKTYGDKVWFSLMNQYTPFERVREKYPELDRKVTRREYDSLLDYALELGVRNAFMQEGGTAQESFIPSFDCEGVEKEKPS